MLIWLFRINRLLPHRSNMLWSQRKCVINVVLRSTYILFLHLYHGLVVVIKPKLAKVRRRRGNITWASQVRWWVPATNCHKCFMIEEEKHNNIVPLGKRVHASVSSSPILQPQARAHTMTSVLILSFTVDCHNKKESCDVNTCVRRAEGGLTLTARVLSRRHQAHLLTPVSWSWGSFSSTL